MEQKPEKKKRPAKKDAGADAAPAKGAEEGIVVTAAKAIGTAAGKIAAVTGAALEHLQPAKSTKVGKLQKKNKARLPRRQKKAKQKAAARKQA